MNLNSARIFASVVAKGSFSKASKELSIPVATVSRRVSELEQELNLKLLERSTRKLRLTEAGATLYDFVSRGVQEMEAGLLALSEQEKNLTGRIRISQPPNFEPMWQILDKFCELYPRVEVDLFVSERRLDFIEDGIDIALRIGEVASLSAVARKLTQYRHKLVATPEYLAANRISKPTDLCNVKTAAWSKKNQTVKWQLGEETITISPHVHANDYLHMRFLALRHKHLTELPPFLCQPFLQSGQLVEVLPKKSLPLQDIHLVYPGRKNISRIIRVFIDYCVENFFWE